MTKEEALKMCLEYIETDAHERKYVRHAIKEALAQPEQKPEHVTYAGNGTAGFLEGERPTGFFIQADRRQPEQEANKDGSPCPEFWDWLPKAYNFDGNGAFTKYNMEVAFLAGKQVSQPAQRTFVGLTDEEIEAAIPFKDLSGEYYYDDVLNIILFIQAKLKRKNAEKN